MPIINKEKRKLIMARSMKLGHCICDPKRPCPCDVFKDQNLCPCAGERPDPVDLSKVRLTEMVHNAGCASKIAAADLERFLSRLPTPDDPAVISGLPSGDDAGIYKLSDDVTVVQTVDVFTPCVDDPYEFGKICAANCLSDIYAMGGIPKTALSVLAFPSETMDGEIMFQMMKGATDVLDEAGCALLGGHSIKDEEIKLGFAITGLIDEKDAASHETARAGDVLVMTKPLGVGVLSFAKQVGRHHEAGMKQAEASMMVLNKEAAEAMTEVGVSACTDVTGFGLFGHLKRMVSHSKVKARVFGDALPSFDGAKDLLADGVIPGAVERNREFVGEDLVVAEGITDAERDLGFDAQTSGGLLISVPAANKDKLTAALETRGIAHHIVGEILDSERAHIDLVKRAGDQIETGTKEKPAESAPKTVADDSAPLEESHDPACCADVFGESEKTDGGGTAPGSTLGGSTAPASMEAFGALMQTTGQAGVLDEKTKELINFALVLLARCDPCLEIHVEKALSMGITMQELDETAWCAIAMGGAPVKMFYTRYMETING